MSRIAAASGRTRRGGTNIPASPTIARTDAMSPATTGSPRISASAKDDPVALAFGRQREDVRIRVATRERALAERAMNGQRV